MFTGTYTAIVTPFKNGELDETALDRLIQMQIKGGVDGIVPVGTTGESPTVDYEEHLEHHRADGEILRAAKSKCSPAPARIRRARRFT